MQCILVDHWDFDIMDIPICVICFKIDTTREAMLVVFEDFE